ncbi:DUF4136 domain-containing protein [Paraburkholderia kururiensis]|uniref:DUF4136 domain-containing protein n=1 Tax=Paraburkholderia kururiensis TaxID=984307 RepID=UPI0005A5F3A8|nr:DUF4136 domain-containing protein [Paraburkholderia kururiensis]
MKFPPVTVRPSLVAAFAALATASLAGCADVSTNVRATSMPRPPGGDTTYRLARTASQEGSEVRLQYEAQVRSALASYGFRDAGSAGANPRYLVSIAHATRAASIGLDVPECGDASGSCSMPPSSGFWFFLRSYVHVLTLRFFDREAAREVYKVVAVSRDHDADASHAVPFLVKSAFAEFPYAGAGAWRVKLHPAKDGALPGVVSIKPLAR